MSGYRYLMVALIVSLFSFVQGKTDSKENRKSVVNAKLLELARTLSQEIKSEDTPINLAVGDFGVPLDQKNEQELSKGVTAMLTAQFQSNNKYHVVEREKFNEVTKELSLSQTGLLDDESAVKAGALLGVSVIVTGSISQLGEYYLVSARAISVETAEILGNAAVEIRRANMIALSSKLIVTRQTSSSTMRSIILPGWGQFFNGQPIKGTLFLLSSAGLGMAFLTSYVIWDGATRDYERVPSTTEKAELAFLRANKFHRVNQKIFAAGALLWTVNVLDALIVGRGIINESLGSEQSAFQLILDPDQRPTLTLSYQF